MGCSISFGMCPTKQGRVFDWLLRRTHLGLTDVVSRSDWWDSNYLKSNLSFLVPVELTAFSIISANCSRQLSSIRTFIQQKAQAKRSLSRLSIRFGVIELFTGCWWILMLSIRRVVNTKEEYLKLRGCSTQHQIVALVKGWDICANPRRHGSPSSPQTDCYFIVFVSCFLAVWNCYWTGLIWYC